jgi:CheY-like chemotaxis protein
MNQSAGIFQILVVEDQDDQWFITHQAFQQLLPSACIVRARDRADTIAKLSQYQNPDDFSPHFVLVDLYLPHREDGYQVLEAIRSLPVPISQLPVIMLSNSINPDDIREAYQRGCTSFVSKPLLYNDWLSYFQVLKTYWCDTVTLPPRRR